MSAPERLPGITLRGYEPGDEGAILEAFNRVFAGAHPGFEPRTMGHWRWSNLENPSGTRIRLAVSDDGRIAAHVSGIAQRALIRRQPGHLSQSVDGFSDPDWSRALKRPGIYARTLNSFNRTYAGPAPEGDTFVWGLPVENAWRIGQAFCKEKLIRTQNKLSAPPDGTHLCPGGRIEVDEVERFPEAAEDLFERAARPHGAIAVRDAPQLDWRFTRHPRNRYQIALARRGDVLVGFAAFRTGTYDGREDGLVCDWLVWLMETKDFSSAGPIF